jgi:beta-glucosidase
VLIISATALMNFFSLSMEIFLGRGQKVVSAPKNVESWDTAFYKKSFNSSDELRSISQKTALNIAEQGEVLLKNDGVLPLKKGASVTPIGYRYLNPVYGGTGSGNVNTSSPYIVTAKSALNKYFKVNTTMENALSHGTARGMNANGYEKANEKGGFTGAGADIIEYASDVYNGQQASCANTTAMIFIGRVGGEGSDLQANVEGSAINGKGYVDGTKHQLQLSTAEKDMIKYAKANCQKTVVILNSANVMEIKDIMAQTGDLAVDAVLWIGDPGGQGFDAMGKILTGEVNPSGKTVDTWMTDIMADPTSSNFGDYKYSNLSMLTGGYPTPVGKPAQMGLLEYEENVYLGYRYYETVNDTAGTFTVFGKAGSSYKDAVQVPFGYGLSYGTNFSQAITSYTEDNKNINVTVRVTNKGTIAGKDAVQVYYNPPYTDFDKTNKIEKSTVNLIGFKKTGDIAPGSYQDVKLTIAKEDMASYSYTRKNSDGTQGAYVLEGGDYVISINKNAHEKYESRTSKINNTIWYDNTNPRQSEKDAQSMLDKNGNPTGIPAASQVDTSAKFVAASNQFQALTDHMKNTNQLTRANGALQNTATILKADEKIAPKGTGKDNGDGTMTMAQMDLTKDPTLGNVKNSKVYTTKTPTTGANNGLSLSSLRGLSYNDPLWNTLLDQLDLSDNNLYVALAASYGSDSWCKVCKQASYKRLRWSSGYCR